jgi:hypothetical protein
MLRCRHSWHMQDVVKIIKRLRWGQIGYANLRHRGYTVRTESQASYVHFGLWYSLLQREGWQCDKGMQAAVPAAGLGVWSILRQDVSLRLGGLHLDTAGSLDASVCWPAPGACRLQHC